MRRFAAKRQSGSRLLTVDKLSSAVCMAKFTLLMNIERCDDVDNDAMLMMDDASQCLPLNPMNSDYQSLPTNTVSVFIIHDSLQAARLLSDPHVCQ